MEKKIRTCYDCQHSRLVDDNPYLVDCTNSLVDYRLLDKYNRNPRVMPSICGEYEPQLIERCTNCGKAINKPVWSWPYWVEDDFDKLPVCSTECKKELQKELDAGGNIFELGSKNEYPF